MAPGFLSFNLPLGKKVLIGFCFLLLIVLGTMALSWNAIPAGPGSESANGGIHVRILAVNDFHGQLSAGESLDNEPVGSIPVLASYLRAAISKGTPAAVFIALPGDVVGASPPESGLLLDEPAILFFNGFANDCCGQGFRGCSASCNMIAGFGNHEFDKGTTELLRKINGGDGTTTITHISDPYPGALATYVCSNIVWKANGTLIAPPYVIRNGGGAKIAFIGADTVNTVSLEMPENVQDVTFLNESESINRYIPEIQNQGVHAIVVLLHEGGSQIAYEGPTRPGGM